jgi:membrane protease YdiL (CAAX protease family)
LNTLHRAREIFWFLFWLVVLTTPVSLFEIYLKTEPPMMSRIDMWCPGAAALITCLMCKVSARSLGWTWPKGVFNAWGYGFAWLYAVPVYLLTWALVPNAFQWGQFATPFANTFHISQQTSAFAALFGIPTTMIFIVIGTMAWALGEELGWRGFLVPRLYERFGLVKTSLISGLIWAVWHYPVLQGADYNAGTQPAYAVACFTVMVIGMAFLMTWLRMASGSIWPCVLLHATHNTLVQGVLDAMTAHTGITPYITTEFGCGMALTILIVAAWTVLTRRRGVVQTPPRLHADSAAAC